MEDALTVTRKVMKDLLVDGFFKSYLPIILSIRKRREKEPSDEKYRKLPWLISKRGTFASLSFDVLNLNEILNCDS